MNLRGRQGMALVTAMAAALIISIIAGVVLSMTLRRFELSAFRSDRAIAGAEAEAGIRYAFARLDLDAAFRTAVQNKAPAAYILRCHDDPALVEDLLVPELHLGAKINTERNADGSPGPNYGNYVGGKHVTVRILYNPAGPGGAAQPFEVRASTDYGTGT